MYKFPEKIIVKILIEETKSWIDTAKRESVTFRINDEMRKMVERHIESIAMLSTYEEIDDWLYEYRRISLDDWVASL